MTQKRQITPITIQRNGSTLNFLAPSGARVAFLEDQSQEIIFDTLADTAEVFGLVNYRDVFAAQKIDVLTARMIDAMPGRDIEPASVPVERPVSILDEPQEID